MRLCGRRTCVSGDVLSCKWASVQCVLRGDTRRASDEKKSVFDPSVMRDVLENGHVVLVVGVV